MKVITTFAAWMDYARGHSHGCDNAFRHNGSLYSFDARPRELSNGALQGRVYRQDSGQSPADIGGFKINGDGSIASLPQELHGVLPEGQAPVVTNQLVCEDVQ